MFADVSSWRQIGGMMQQHIASPGRRCWRPAPKSTPASEEEDVSSQFEVHRWEDDGGAIATKVQGSPLLLADYPPARAA